MKRIALIVTQIIGLAIIAGIGNMITEVLHLPLPGTLVGMILLFVLLLTGVVKLEWFEQGDISQI